MMKNRCILSLLLCGVMLYYATPRLTLTGNGIEMYFSFAWLTFLLLAIAGNLAAILYAPKKKSHAVTVKSKKTQLRSYQH